MVSSRQFCLAYGVSALVYQLRNAKTLRFTVTKDDTGEVYYSNVLENAIKSTWWADYGLFYYNSDYRMWDMTCEYEGGLISNVPDGAYTYTIEALGEGASEEDVQSVSIPLTVDSEGPELLSYEAVEENGVRYLDVELSDNYYLMGVQLTDETESRLCLRPPIWPAINPARRRSCGLTLRRLCRWAIRRPGCICWTTRSMRFSATW